MPAEREITIRDLLSHSSGLQQGIAGLLVSVGSQGGQVMDGPVDIGVLLKGEALPQGCYRLRTLGRGGIVQIHQGLPVHSTGKGGKLTANLCEGHSHWISLQIYINLRYD